MNKQKIIIHNNATELTDGLIQRWQSISEQAISHHGSFHVALAGGSTPKELYQQLANKNIAATLPWKKTHIYFGDERCVPPDHDNSNYKMANSALLRHVPIPKENIHRIIGENSDHHQSSSDYGTILNQCLPRDKGELCFDLVLLGIGPDGHIASLFPDTNILGVRDQLCAAVYIDKFSSWRISITFPVIEQARHVLLAAVGDGKANIINEILNADNSKTGRYPVQAICQLIEWHLDKDAAGLLPDTIKLKICKP